MRKLWRWISVILGAATLTAGLAVGATQAGATEQSTIHITSAIQITQPLHYAAPASCTSDRHYKGGWVTFVYCDNQYNRHECSSGQNGDIFGPLYVANGCSTQVRIYTDTGVGLCVNPKSSTGVLKKDYTQYSITGDTGNC